MPKMRITDLGRSRLYLTRNMWASENEAYIEPECVVTAKALGYVEDIPAEEPAPVRRGRPPKQPAEAAPVVYGGEPAAKSSVKPMTKPEEPTIEEKTRADLIKMAEERGVELPSGYVTRDTLVDLVGAADDDDGA